MPIEAGKFDPVPAQFLQREVDYTNNEPVNGTESVFYETWVRFPWQARSGSERNVVKQSTSSNQILVRLRRDEKSILIDPSMFMLHNGQRYGIISINPIPSNERDEIELLVQYVTPGVIP